MFDIHLMDSFEKSIKAQMKNQFENVDVAEVKVPAQSYMSSFFMKNLFNMPIMSPESVFTKTMDYRHSFVKKLADDSLELNILLETYKSSQIKMLDSKRKLLASSYQFFKWVAVFDIV